MLLSSAALSSWRGGGGGFFAAARRCGRLLTLSHVLCAASATSSSFTPRCLQYQSQSGSLATWASSCFPSSSTSSCWARPSPPCARSLSTKTMADANKEFVLPIDQPLEVLDAKVAFEGLTHDQMLYAHYLSRASYYGGLIVLQQTSPESVSIFRLLRMATAYQTPEELRRRAAEEAGVSQENFDHFLVYCAGFFANMGNYKGFGDSKFIPGLPAEEFEKIYKVSERYKTHSHKMNHAWGIVKDKMYDLSEDKLKHLGLSPNGVTTYFTDNCNQEDADLVSKFLMSKKIEAYNTRVMKVTDPETNREKYHILKASVNQVEQAEEETFEGKTFIVTGGDHSGLLKLVVDNLRKAQDYARSGDQKSMLEHYIESFKTGSLDEHKKGSTFWVSDRKPPVESYIGFIETYRDPAGTRGEFEGFVAVVNLDQSVKFNRLVNLATELLEKLPWPKEFEKDVFSRPDFTSLDVLTFAGSGVPAGINIPNYDDVRQEIGFKNVNLGNVVSASYKTDKKTKFVSESDHELLKQWKLASFELQVGLHELLGHGSGKLLQEKDENRDKNFDPNLEHPVKGGKVDKWYKYGETYDSVFSSLSSAYEECRAEAVGLVLSTEPAAVEVFGLESDMSDVVYVNWLSLILAAVRGVEMYNPLSQEWKQAHSHARYVLMGVMLEAGQGFLTVTEVTNAEDGEPDLLISMDRSKIDSVGKPAVSEFLKKLQVYKSTADIASARELFDKYSKVSEEGSTPFAKWRKIILDRKVPRKVLVQANTFLNESEKQGAAPVTLKTYPGTLDGMVESWSDRFPADEDESLDKLLVSMHMFTSRYFDLPDPQRPDSEPRSPPPPSS